MDYKEKRKYWAELHSTKYINKDIELLKQHAPKSRALNLVPRFKQNAPGRLEKEILWSLLEVCTPEEIIKNRKGSTIKKSSGTKGNSRKKRSTTKSASKKTNAPISDLPKTDISKEVQISNTKNISAEEKKKSNQGNRVPGDKLGQS